MTARGSSGERCKRRFRRSSPTGHPRGDCEVQKGVFPQRFPPSRRGTRSFTSFLSHTHRRWGSIVGRGTTADRDRPGAAAARDLRVFNRGQYEYEYGNLRKRCATTATLGYWRPSELTILEFFAVLESNRLATRLNRARLVTSTSHLDCLSPLI